MSSQAEVRRLADEVLAAYPRLDVLLNNVGGFWAHRHVTADGLEHTFALNHLAPFLLTSLLLDRLDRQRPGPRRHRVVQAHRHGHDRLRRPDGRAEVLRVAAYNQSKLANVMFTYELARRLEGTGVTATALHPGLTSTAFSAEDPAMGLLVKVMRPFMRSPARARTPPSTWRAPPRRRASAASTSPTGRSRSPATPRTTRRSRRGCGRSAPISSAFRATGDTDLGCVA